MSENDVAIHAVDLSKKFTLSRERRMALKERVVRGRAPRGEDFWALRDATFDVHKGSMFGIVGHNGSGKSTALKVIAGIYRPTSGTVEVEGRLSALLELGAGFHPELTGRENISLNASILGMSKKQIADATDEIIEFAGLGRFIDSPIKTYSSGMYVRLGFAVAVKVDPEILVIDEVIAVGDEDFQRKCFDYIHHLRRRGSTIVIVTHSLSIVADRCDQAMWLDHGRVQEVGPAREVVDSYMTKVNEDEAERAELAQTQAREARRAAGEDVDAQDDADAEMAEASPFRRGSGEVRVTAIELLDEAGESAPFLLSGQPGTVRMHFRCKEAIDDVIFGLGFWNQGLVNVAGPNSGRNGAIRVAPGVGHIDFHMPSVLLAAGSYNVSSAVVSYGSPVDYLDREFEVRVRSGSSDEPGTMLMPGSWSVDRVRTSAEGERRPMQLLAASDAIGQQFLAQSGATRATITGGAEEGEGDSDD